MEFGISLCDEASAAMQEHLGFDELPKRRISPHKKSSLSPRSWPSESGHGLAYDPKSWQLESGHRQPKTK
ncbi:hypothetical protein D9754_07770 [Planomicrobium sp. Y74]|nr:hypothetical protein D9754_07770 [Planomicrobium sp. Y74]